MARIATTTVAELARVAIGRSYLEPDPKDKRFADPAWSENAVFRRVVRAYLAVAESAQELVDVADLEWRDDKRVRFLVDNLVEALAPSNSPLLNPAVWKRAIDTGGTSLTHGAATMVSDLARAPRVPSMVEPDAFVVGRDLAVTPGKVIFRNDQLELIQYMPQTDQVRETPLLIIPPTINKFYVVDLAPGRSLIEHLVGSGQQVFIVSWRNPDQSGRDWGADAYCGAIIAALDAIETITGSARTAMLALCSGGILTSMLLAHLAATDQLDRIAALSLLVTVLDQQKAGAPPPRGPSPVRSVRVISTVRRWWRCSPGYDRATSSGTTGSTTTCSESRRRPSTSCPGTLTAPACPHGCTAISSRSPRTTS
jgi:hypothetical protein